MDKSKRYREANKEKVVAQNRARWLYPDAQPCSIENCELMGERHHSDYSQPDKITWLCRKHHKEHHRNVCSLCDLTHHAKGFCKTHYRKHFPEKHYGEKFGKGHR